MNETGLAPKWVIENFEKFEQQLNGQANAPIHKLRERAYQTFSKTGFPTHKDEDWRYTNISALTKGGFALPLSPLGDQVTESDIEHLLINKSNPRAVFLNGHFNALLSTLSTAISGITFRSMASVLKEDETDSEDREYILSKFSDEKIQDHNAFVALNTAFVQDGVLLKVPRGVRVVNPVEILFLTTISAKNIVTYPRVLLTVGEGAEVSVVETHGTVGGKNSLSNSITQVSVECGAHVNYYKVEVDDMSCSHIGTFSSTIATRGVLNIYTTSFGGSIIRNNVGVHLAGEGAYAGLFGITAISGTQHVDNSTVIDHAVPNCESNELYKGIYDNSSHGVFSGTIIVRKDAQKTNAFQSNQSILLSKDAAVDSKPQLKIWANDVKCTHGATIGELDEEALFYLRSRGIGEKEARTMLAQAFAYDALTKFSSPEIRAHVEKHLNTKTGANNN